MKYMKNIREVKDSIREWWGSEHQDYDSIPEHRVHSEQEKEIWKDVLVQSFGTTKKLKVLDIGTGTGFLALLLAEMGHDVTGADWSKSMLEKAKEKANNSNLSIKFMVDDAEDLSFEDDLFDVVVSRHLIWTLPNPAMAMKEWRRVTKPGGKIIVDASGKHSIGDHHFGKEIGEKLPFYNGADPEEIIKMFEDFGLVNVTVQSPQESGDKSGSTFLIEGEKPVSDNRLDNPCT